MDRDIAYFGFYDRMRSGVPTEEEFKNDMLNNKMTPHTFAIWNFELEGDGTILEKYINTI
jgi:hypothetical protein